MASHQLAIAKASFSAGLLRPDPTSVTRDEITAFHSALDKALSHCSFANIQTCKSWLLHYVVSSSNRVGGWAKYLVTLSGSLVDNDSGPRPKTSAKRKRLHILYLLNDLFHHTKYHRDSPAAFSTLTGSCQPYIVELLSYAAVYDREKNLKHHRRLDDLLNIWAKNGYYGADYVDKLREVVKAAAVSGPVKTSIGAEDNNNNNSDTGHGPKTTGRDVPFVMPSTHGDPSTPFYDLPAGNMVPHIIPNSTLPIRPDSIKPLQFLAGPADANLVNALKDFMKDVDHIYGSGKPEPKDDEVVDMDELGQPVIRDAATGEILHGETYYGWSRGFCEQMKKRNGRRSRSRSRSGSWSRSPSRGESRSRSPSSSRRGPSRRSYSRSRSASPRRQQQSRSRERSYSPPDSGLPAASAPGHPYPPPYPQFPNAPPPPPSQYQPPFPPQMYAPPPPPPNFQGQWPPPPPGMPVPMSIPPGMMNMNFPAGASPPPPPPGPGGFPGFQLQGGHFPPVHGGRGAPGAGPGGAPPGAPGSGAGAGVQQLPPGSFRFPQPHSGGRGRGWR